MIQRLGNAHILLKTWLVIKKFLKAIFLYDEGSTKN